MKKLLKKILPPRMLRNWSIYKNKGKSEESIFTEIYEKGLWGVAPDNRKYCSGMGTIDENVRIYQQKLIEFIDGNNVEKIFEIGCGDFSVMQTVLNQVDVNYIGTDLVTTVIKHHLKENYNPKWHFEQLNAITTQNLPDADLCIIRQVLQHLSNSQIQIILSKIKKYKYVLITEHLPMKPTIKNGDKEPGGYIRLQNKLTSGVYVGDPPFNLPVKVWLQYRHDEADYYGKFIPANMVTYIFEGNSIN